MPSAASFLAQVIHLADEAPRVLNRALGTGGAYADLFYERTLHHRLTWRQQVGGPALDRPTRASDRWIVEGVGVRVLGEGTEGFAVTADCSKQALREAAQDAATQGSWAGAVRQTSPLAKPSIHLDVPDDAPDAIAASEKTALVRTTAEAAFSLDDRVRRVAVAYQDRVRRIVVATSEGMLQATVSMLLGLRVEVTLVTNQGAIMTHAVAGCAGGFGYFFEHPPDHLARQAVKRAQRLIGAKSIATGTMPVVLAAGWGGVWLHEAVGHLLEADILASGGSPFAGHLGRAVAAPTVTLVDDATLAGGRGTYLIDDEGTRAHRTMLIADGVLYGYLTDRRTARGLGLACTGNGRRQDYRHRPVPRMTNLLLLPGEAEPADLIADVTDGLYVQAVGQGVVHPGGGFAFDVLEGYRIEHGRLGAPVTGARLVGTGPAVLNAVAGVGRDLQVDTARGLCKKAGQVVPVSVGMPTVLVRAMGVESSLEMDYGVV